MSLADDQIERKDENHPLDVLSSRMGKIRNPNIPGALAVIQKFHEEVEKAKENLLEKKPEEEPKEEPINPGDLLDGIRKDMER